MIVDDHILIYDLDILYEDSPIEPALVWEDLGMIHLPYHQSELPRGSPWDDEAKAHSDTIAPNTIEVGDLGLIVPHLSSLSV